MKIYYSTTSPYVRKVRVGAFLLGCHERINWVLTNPFASEEELLHLNPLSKIPVLLLPDGQVICGSDLILEYLDQQEGHGKFFPPKGPLTWTLYHDKNMVDGMIDAAVACVLEARRPEWLISPLALERQRDKIKRVVTYLEEKGTHPSFEQPRSYEISLACALGYLDFRLPEMDWRSQAPRLAAWFDQFNDQPAMQATKPA